MTFRVIQISAQLVAPVVLAWGLVELVARGPAARFGARLAAAALIVVIGVILATDPLAAKPFGTAWPSAAVHYQLIPHYALIGLHLARRGGGGRGRRPVRGPGTRPACATAARDGGGGGGRRAVSPWWRCVSRCPLAPPTRL